MYKNGKYPTSCLQFFFPSNPLTFSKVNANLTEIGENQPQIITNETIRVNNGTFLLVTENGMTYKSILPLDYTNFGDISVDFAFSQNFTVSISFSKEFPGKHQVSERKLGMATLPVTINALNFDNWSISTSYAHAWFKRSSVAFYYITPNEFLRLQTIFGELPEFVSLTQFMGNGTYVLLGEPRTPTPFWQFYLGILMSAIWFLAIGIVVYFFITKFF